MLDIYDLIQQVKDRPGLYIGNESIHSLYMFLNGYQFARRQLNIPPSLQEEQFRQFQPWLQNKLDVQTTISWCQLILSKTDGEKSAFYKFFEYFHSFIQEQEQPLQTNGAVPQKI